MKKSEIYRFAMMAVVNSEFPAPIKLDIVEEFIRKKSLEEWNEEYEAKKAQEAQEAQEEVNNG